MFTARRIAPLEHNIRKLANELIDGFVDDGEVDVNTEWCQPLPSTIFISILGLPLDDLHSFMRFKNMTLGIGMPKDASPEERMELRNEAVVWLQAYFNDSLDARDAERRSGRRHDRVADDHRGRRRAPHPREHPRHPRPAHDRRASTPWPRRWRACSATSPAIPTAAPRSLADPSLWPDVVEELLRFESPVTDGGRIAMKDLVLPSGEEIPEGTMMNVSWSAANVDPDYFPDPLAVEFGRRPNPHIAFASGFHRCLGSHLARMELRVALEAFHQRIPNYEIKPGVELDYSGNPRTPLHLPLVWKT